MACSKENFAELIDVLARNKFDKHLNKNVRSVLLEPYARSVQFFDTPLAVTGCEDPKDNKFLALALVAKAKVIVSGDKKYLLIMSPYQGTEIVSLGAFVDSYVRYAA